MTEGSKIGERNRNSLFMVFDAFKINQFGDLIDARVGFNSQNIFEVIDGKVHNKLAIQGITEVVRDSSQFCSVRLTYNFGDFVSYIFRPEDYDEFLANIFHVMEDLIQNRPGGAAGLSIMEQRVALYSIFSVKPTEQSVPLIGLQESPKIDEVLLSGISPNADTDTLTAQLNELNCNSLMKNDLNFSTLLHSPFNSIIEVSSFFDHSTFTQIQGMLKEHREEVTRVLFKSLFEKNILVVDDLKPAIVMQSIPELLSRIESKNRETDKRIGYLAGRAKQYETFLTKKEVLKNILYCCKLLHFLTISTNNSLFFKELAIHINIPKAGITDLYKSFIRAVVRLALQSSGL